jgi:hypothetical protein
MFILDTDDVYYDVIYVLVSNIIPSMINDLQF